MVARPRLAGGQQATVALVHLELDLYSQILRFALEVKGVQWQGMPVSIESVFDYLEPWSVRFNPSLVYPVFFVDGVRTDGLKEQLQALEIELKGPNLRPRDSEGRRRCEFWIEEFLTFPVEAYSHMWATGAFETLYDLTSLAHLEAIDIGEDAGSDLSVHYQALRERFAAVVRLTQDTKGRKHLERRLGEQLARLNRVLGQGDYLAGNAFSMADIVWSVFLARLEYLERPLESFDVPLDDLSRWYERVKTRDDYSAAGVWDQARPERLARHFVRVNRLPVIIALVLGVSGLISLVMLAMAI
jgi:tetrachloro-p-hydroquinone reductive dehalogenase